MKRLYAMILVWMWALCLILPALSETAALTVKGEVIESEAFSGLTAITSLTVPEGTIFLGEGAFSGCAALRSVTLPVSLADIGSGCFDECAEALYITCPKGSRALEFARLCGFDYDADTVYRALLIAQKYLSYSSLRLYGTGNDANAMAALLSSQKTTPFAVTQYTDLTADGIVSAISSTFSDATDEDVSLLYYSGHGDVGGSLVGADSSLLTAQELRSALDAIPGRKIVIVDACYSGALTEEGGLAAAGENVPQTFPLVFASAFASAKRSASAASSSSASSQYYVMTACQAGELSGESMIYAGTRAMRMGVFTYYLCYGCGWDGVAKASTDRPADTNADAVVTWDEAYRYACQWALEYYEDESDRQNAAVLPEDCTAFSPFRN